MTSYHKSTVRTGWVALIALATSGCGVNAGTTTDVIQHPMVVAGSAFALPPADAAVAPVQAPVTEPMAPAAVVGAVGSATVQDPTVKITGRALLDNAAARMANVREGQVTGTPVFVVDARNNKTLGKAVTYYDGSFSVEVAVNYANLPVLVTLDLIDHDDVSQRVAMSAPMVLHPGDAEQKVAVTPGSTALTLFLNALATTNADREGVQLQATTFATPVGEPKFGALIAGMNEDERASFARMAGSADDLKSAASVGAFRQGLNNFLGRMSVSSK